MRWASDLRTLAPRTRVAQPNANPTKLLVTRSPQPVSTACNTLHKRHAFGAFCGELGGGFEGSGAVTCTIRVAELVIGPAVAFRLST